jgi:hypothetical protein
LKKKSDFWGERKFSEKLDALPSFSKLNKVWHKFCGERLGLGKLA